MPSIDKYKYARFDKMPKERLKELHKMLEAAHPCSRIARIVRDKWWQCTDVKEQTLERQLQRYREDCRTKPNFSIKKPEEGDDYKLNRQRLQEAIEIQENRFYKMYYKEKDTPMVLGTVDRELKLLVEFVEKSMKLHHDADRLKVVEKYSSINDYEENMVKIRVTEETMRRIEEVTSDDFFKDLNSTAFQEKAESKLTIGKKKKGNYTSSAPILPCDEPTIGIE